MLNNIPADEVGKEALWKPPESCLRQAGVELERIARLASPGDPNCLLTGTAATKSAFINLVVKSTVLHLGKFYLDGCFPGTLWGLKLCFRNGVLIQARVDYNYSLINTPSGSRTPKLQRIISTRQPLRHGTTFFLRSQAFATTTTWTCPFTGRIAFSPSCWRPDIRISLDSDRPNALGFPADEDGTMHVSGQTQPRATPSSPPLRLSPPRMLWILEPEELENLDLTRLDLVVLSSGWSNSPFGEGTDSRIVGEQENDEWLELRRLSPSSQVEAKIWASQEEELETRAKAANARIRQRETPLRLVELLIQAGMRYHCLRGFILYLSSL
ncbi:unnamed protein product [Protopolystoma xenopodis]|uniref:Uncharacterized protein n=1 Tax=Protopolystoma xenopodis TaxID=117903 RepID=A0A3S4ZDH9_9PLAT|nr:unnamed protein product [Protopolystoma xenopodis]